MINLPDDPRHALMLLSSMIEPGDAELDDLLGEVGPIEAVERIWEGNVPERLHRITSASVACTRDPRERCEALVSATAEQEDLAQEPARG